MELHLDRQWFQHGDIIEGVRALIIDKDKQPCWNHPPWLHCNASGSTILRRPVSPGVHRCKTWN